MFNFLSLFTRVYPNVDAITAEEACALAEKGELVLVDVRTEKEIARTGKAAGALHIELPYIRHKANRTSPHFDSRLDPAKAIALYCENGSRSLLAARMMKKLGYEKVYNMGPFRDWQNAKLPVET
jgi:rhodanese-related sulfurtransferase